jgi:hypothetical protein
MTESILITIKALLGISPDNTDFDSSLIAHINSVFMILNQLGVGTSTPFSISGSTEVWSSFLSDSKDLEAVKSYMYKKVQIMFDPPTSGTVMDASNRIIDELEWRLNVAADPYVAESNS